MPTRPTLPPTRPKHAAPPRASTSARGYGAAHRRARRQILGRHPVCQRCEEHLATDLHHIDKNTSNRRAENLLAVCERCHRALHGR